MITTRAAHERGHADYGWLDTSYTFSFSEYVDPRWTGFGPLRVINQDVIAPGRGFGTHGHRDMEIISWVIRGALEHRDSMGSGSVIRPGDVQLMSAGSGVTHSEFNPSTSEPTELLQIWIQPVRAGAAPRYQQRAFEAGAREGGLQLVVAPDGRDGSLVIGQDACVYAGLLSAGEVAAHDLAPSRRAWLQVASGRVLLNGVPLETGDGAAVAEEHSITLEGAERTELLFFDLP